MWPLMLALAGAGLVLATSVGLAQPGPAASPSILGTGSPERGRALLLQRHETGCILCHVVPGLPHGGQIGPALGQMARRYSAEQLGERIADARRFHPQTIMPPYRSVEGLQHVAPAFQGKPVLTAQALEDIVSYLLAASDAAPAAAAAPSHARP